MQRSAWWQRSDLRRPLPRPTGRRRPESEQIGSVVAHLAGLPLLGIGVLLVGRPVVWLALAMPFGPLLVRALAGRTRSWIAHHATEALNFSLTMAALVVVTSGGLSVAGRTAVTTFLIPLLLLVLLLLLVNWLTLMTVGAIEAGRGVAFRYPITLRPVAVPAVRSVAAALGTRDDPLDPCTRIEMGE